MTAAASFFQDTLNTFRGRCFHFLMVIGTYKEHVTFVQLTIKNENIADIADFYQTSAS